MSFLSTVKRHLTGLPYPIGKAVSFVPYEFRPSIGRIYKARTKDLLAFEGMSTDERKEFIFSRVKSVLDFAVSEVPFYGQFYAAREFDYRSIKTFDDISGIPSVKKSDFLASSLEKRTSGRGGAHMVNTGGSSGKTLELYIQDSSVGHEWAHMHEVWRRVDFRHSEVRIVFAGRANIDGAVVYDSARHQFNVNIYAGWPTIASALSSLYRKHSPTYLHGYPSAIFDFLLWVKENDPALLASMQQCTQGLLLGSEFPSPQLREQAERILSCRSVSWYGHTERAVLAYEADASYRYSPMMTYGFCEAAGSADSSNLIGTSYYNYATPLIRYDTEDKVVPTFQAGLVQSFAVSEGRSGEYVVDEEGTKIFLTALIFGRHHEIFNLVSQLQVRQSKHGVMDVFVVPRSGGVTADMVRSSFDSSNLRMELHFFVHDSPFVTASGKVPLLVPSGARRLSEGSIPPN